MDNYERHNPQAYYTTIVCSNPVLARMPPTVLQSLTSSVSREFKIELIGIKITSLGAILGQVIITFDQNSVQAPLHASIDNPGLAWQREDPLSDFVKVLDNMEIQNKMADSGRTRAV